MLDKLDKIFQPNPSMTVGNLLGSGSSWLGGVGIRYVFDEQATLPQGKTAPNGNLLASRGDVIIELECISLSFFKGLWQTTRLMISNE